jgi:hypothetical protein
MRTAQHTKDLENWLNDLERVGCLFQPICPGPDKRPVDMMTCFSCRNRYNLRRRLGKTLDHCKNT